MIASAADRQMAHLRTFQAGPQAEACQRLLNEVARARLCLLDPEKKAAYDAELRAAVQAAATMPPPLPRTSAPTASSLGRALRRSLLPGKSNRRRFAAWGHAKPLRRLLTVASAAIAALACAWLVGRYFGVFGDQQAARQTSTPKQTAVAASTPAASVPQPQQTAKPIVPAASAGAPAQSPGAPLPSSPSAKPGVPIAKPSLAKGASPNPLFFPPPAKPAEGKQSDAAPAGAAAKAGLFPPGLPPGFPAETAKEPSKVAAADSAKPKISALAPPGSPPVEDETPEVPPPQAGEAEELFQIGLGLLAEGRYLVARQKLYAALKADRDRFDASFALGLLEAIVAHDWERAERHFSQCAKLEPKSIAVLNNLALVRLRTNKEGLALRHWDAVLNAGLPPPDEVVQNVARVCFLVTNRRLVLSPEHVRALDVLARKMDVATHAKQVGMFRYMRPDGEAGTNFRWPSLPGLAEDWCMLCLGYGRVKCPDCARGAVRTPATRVLGVDPSTGTVVTQTGTVRSRCSRCGGEGWVDCRMCSDGHQR
ncbi:MAG: hypothetical protein NUV77_06405 [Thermoguttaceae bacterium]|nr:hypothetical protein [Thermoguttaceae bacterium]